ncbi:MAG: BlaI/MecI/CopY family transcriptional regulator [Bacteroidetes bacterium]|nr:MAG: BlaI/MecI/CopY family transcriptional regulator [Bacteroidota bacterium]
MKELTKAEEELMQILWKLRKGFINDILDELPDPKPAYNTVSTIVRILEKKGFVDYTPYGKAHEYFPLVSKKDYTKTYFGHFMKNYFGNSYREMVSFFTTDDNLNIRELEELKQAMAEEIIRKKIEDDE